MSALTRIQNEIINIANIANVTVTNDQLMINFVGSADNYLRLYFPSASIADTIAERIMLGQVGIIDEDVNY